MKPINRYEINEWSFNDCVDWLAMYGTENIDVVAIIAKRLRELHEKHRWIPVGERMPTEEDADKNGRVLWYCKDQHNESLMWDMPRWKISYERVTHWKRIDKPEGV